MTRLRILSLIVLAALAAGVWAQDAPEPETFAVTGYEPSSTTTWLRLLAVSGESAVFAAEPASSSGDDTIALYTPSFSPDGRLVAYVSIADDRTGDLYVLDLETGENIQLFAEGGDSFADPAFSPDGAALAAAVTAADGTNADIYVFSSDGTSATPLTETPDVSEAGPVWSPDGASLAYLSAAEEAVRIVVVPAGGGEPVVVDESDSPRTGLTWAADGELLYFVAQTPNELGTAIYALPIGGGAIDTIYDPSAAGDTAPGIEWLTASPDGTRLAFVESEYRFSAVGTVERVQRLTILTLATGTIESAPLGWSQVIVTGLVWRPAAPVVP